MTKRVIRDELMIEINLPYNKYSLNRIDCQSVRVLYTGNNKELTEYCVLWTGPIYNSGYGAMSYNGKQTGVHRIAYMISMGIDSIPEKNANGDLLDVAHKCNVKLCCEPSHLYLATKFENGRDRVNNGTTKGEKNPCVKISEDNAKAIKLSKGTGTQQQRADRFNVSKSIVKNIDSGNSWAHLPDSNGDNLLKKRDDMYKKQKVHGDKLKEIPWSQKFYDEANSKINDPAYTVIDPTHNFNGTNCILWIRGFIGPYPVMTVCNQDIRAHIIACAIGNGNVRPEGLQAAHDCGQKACVNPLHLTFKTGVENVADKFLHKTQPIKLSWEQIVEIRKRYVDGESQASLARCFNVKSSHISNIINLKTRKNH